MVLRRIAFVLAAAAVGLLAAPAAEAKRCADDASTTYSKLSVARTKCKTGRRVAAAWWLKESCNRPPPTQPGGPYGAYPECTVKGWRCKPGRYRETDADFNEGYVKVRCTKGRKRIRFRGDATGPT